MRCCLLIKRSRVFVFPSSLPFYFLFPVCCWSFQPPLWSFWFSWYSFQPVSSSTVLWLGSVVLTGLPGVSAERMSYIDNRGVCWSLGWIPEQVEPLLSSTHLSNELWLSCWPFALAEGRRSSSSCGFLCRHVDAGGFTLKNSPSLCRTQIW